MSEDFVSYTIMRYLKNNDWVITQYHPPGGQANFGLNVKGEIVFSDIIATKNKQIIVIENKPSYSKDDITKLRKIKRDSNAKNKICNHVDNWLKNHSKGIIPEKKIFFAHGFVGQHPGELLDIIFLKIDSEGNVEVISSKNNKLKI